MGRASTTRGDRASSPPEGSRELLAAVRRDAPATLHDQLCAQLRAAIRRGALRPGAALPSTRTLAADLGVSRGVVVEAYGQLAAEGWLVSRDRAVPRVAAAAPAAPAPAAPAAVGGDGAPRERAVSRPRHDLRPGVPDLGLFPRTAWSAAVRRVVREATVRDLAYPDPQGPLALRAALAEYLGRVRGVVAGPEDVVACAGVAQGLGLVARALRRAGARRLAVEDPAHVGGRGVLAASGLEIVPVPVDEAGLVVEALEGSGADAVVVTPAHQFPTGVVLAPERRAALLAWAGRGERLVIEDDYDAEFRYDRAPVGALQGLRPDRVVHAGSASKTLAPALRLGWLVVPPALRAAVRDEKALADLGSPTLDALALAHLLAAGAYDRHLRRCRARYARRRDAFVRELAARLPAVRPEGLAAGLHVAARLPEGVGEQAAVAACARRGLAVGAVGAHVLAAARAPALLLGYATLPEAAAPSAVASLAAALAEG